jgi:hypothetical protein
MNGILLGLIIHRYLMIPHGFQGLIKAKLSVKIIMNKETGELLKEELIQVTYKFANYCFCFLRQYFRQHHGS